MVATAPVIVNDYEVPAGKVRVVLPEYDDHRFFPVSEASRATMRKRLGFEGSVVPAVGRLARNKGYDPLIESFAILAAASRTPCFTWPRGLDRGRCNRADPRRPPNDSIASKEAIFEDERAQRSVCDAEGLRRSVK